MTIDQSNKRVLGIGTVSLTKVRPKRDWGDAIEYIKLKVKEILLESNYLLGAPFLWISLIFRYGLVNEDKPHYQKINKKYGDLPLAIEIDTHDLLDASLEELKVIFERATLIALIHAGKKYDRPVELLEKKLEELTRS